MSAEIRNLDEEARKQNVQLPEAVLAKVMSAMGLDYTKDSQRRGWAVAMVKGAMSVEDLKVVKAEEVEAATDTIVAYAKGHEQSGPRGDGFRVEWADERFADLFFSDKRPRE